MPISQTVWLKIFPCKSKSPDQKAPSQQKKAQKTVFADNTLTCKKLRLRII
jgi:hypothetical protein